MQSIFGSLKTEDRVSVNSTSMIPSSPNGQPFLSYTLFVVWVPLRPVPAAVHLWELEAIDGQLRVDTSARVAGVAPDAPEASCSLKQLRLVARLTQAVELVNTRKAAADDEAVDLLDVTRGSRAGCCRYHLGAGQRGARRKVRIRESGLVKKSKGYHGGDGRRRLQQRRGEGRSA